MTKENEMPDEIGVCAFNDGTYEVYPNLANVPPATKYVRAQPLPVDRQDALNWLENHARCPDNHKETIRATLSETPEERGRRLHPPIALSKPNDVDVEGLVEEYTESLEKYKGNTGDYYPNNHAAMIGCMEKALQSQGYLSQPKEDWRDISTAPKDGKEIMVYDGEHTWFAILTNNEWCDASDNSPLLFLTHWMPLPTPPNAQQEDK